MHRTTHCIFQVNTCTIQFEPIRCATSTSVRCRNHSRDPFWYADHSESEKRLIRRTCFPPTRTWTYHQDHKLGIRLVHQLQDIKRSRHSQRTDSSRLSQNPVKGCNTSSFPIWNQVHSPRVVTRGLVPPVACAGCTRVAGGNLKETEYGWRK